MVTKKQAKKGETLAFKLTIARAFEIAGTVVSLVVIILHGSHWQAPAQLEAIKWKARRAENVAKAAAAVGEGRSIS